MRACWAGAWLILCTGVAHAQGVGNYFVQTPAAYGADSFIRQGIKDQCALDVMLGNDVLQSVAEKFPGALPFPSDAVTPDDKVIKLTILGADGVGGGGWSGPKTITAKAELWQNGQLVRSIVKQAGSRLGGFGYMSGVCSIFGHTSKSLAKHFLRWVLSPSQASAKSIDTSVSDDDKAAAKRD